MNSEDIFLFTGAAAALIHAGVRFFFSHREKKVEEAQIYADKLSLVQHIIRKLNEFGFDVAEENAANYIGKSTSLPDDIVKSFPKAQQVINSFASLFEEDANDGRNIVNAVLLDALQHAKSKSFLNNIANEPLLQRIEESYSQLSRSPYVTPVDISLYKQLSEILASTTILTDYSSEFIVSLVKWLGNYLNIRHNATISRGNLPLELKNELNAILALLNNPEFVANDDISANSMLEIQIMKVDFASQAQNIKALASAYAEITANSIDVLEPETLLTIFPASAILGKWNDVRNISAKLRDSHPDFLTQFKIASRKMRNIPDMSVLVNLAEDFNFYDYCYATSTSEAEIQEGAQNYMIQYDVEQKAKKAEAAKKAQEEAEAAKKAEEEAAIKAAEEEAEAVRKAAEEPADVDAEAEAESKPEDAEAEAEPKSEEPVAEEPSEESVEKVEEEAAVEAEKTEEAVEAVEEATEVEKAEEATEVEKTEEATEVSEETEDVVASTEEVAEQDGEETAVVEAEKEEEEEYVPVVGGTAYTGPDSGPHPITLRDFSKNDYSYAEWDIREVHMDTIPERTEAVDPSYLKSLRDDMNSTRKVGTKAPKMWEPGSNVMRRMGCLVTMKSFAAVPVQLIGICSEDKMVLAMQVDIPNSLRPIMQSEYYEFVRDQEYVDTVNNTQAWDGYMALKQRFTQTDGQVQTNNKTSFFFNVRIIIAPKKKGVKGAVKPKGKLAPKKGAVKSSTKTKLSASKTTPITIEEIESSEVPQTEETENVEDVAEATEEVTQVETEVAAPETEVETETDTKVEVETEVAAPEVEVETEVTEAEVPAVEADVETEVTEVEAEAPVVEAEAEDIPEVASEEVTQVEEASAPIEDVETETTETIEKENNESESEISDSIVMVDSGVETSSIVLVDSKDAEESSDMV